MFISMHWGSWGCYWTARCCAMKGIFGLSGVSDCPSCYLKTILQRWRKDGPCCKSSRHKPSRRTERLISLNLPAWRVGESLQGSFDFCVKSIELLHSSELIAQQQRITLEEMAGRSFCRPSKARRGPCMLSVPCTTFLPHTNPVDGPNLCT